MLINNKMIIRIIFQKHVNNIKILTLYMNIKNSVHRLTYISTGGTDDLSNDALVEKEDMSIR